MLKIGLVINPYAGIGGSVALKGSDGPDVRERALALGAELRAPQRCQRALAMLADADIHVQCWGGAMGGDICAALGLRHQIIGLPKSADTGPQDTLLAVQALRECELDLLVFGGGDGTARDVLDALGSESELPVLGIPCGVKMHSGVFAVAPEAAGEILLRLVAAGLVNVQLREVRDIDEAAFRQGQVKSKFYGELLVPEVGSFLQQTKISGVESKELVAAEIAADVVERMQADTLYVIGPGSTTAAITEELGVNGTLLGVDVVIAGQLSGSDVTANELLALLQEWSGPSQILVTAIGGQGHVFGRGNQQLSPAVIREVGVDNIVVVAGKGKIAALSGRPLLVDTNDPELDRELAGYRRILTGYQDAILYPVVAVQ
ncbi:ATP-NAD kinase [Halieaceae bacterium IMCC14734]|uniref:ATP-NAD kinase n=1 Tax=Candidatus Litorirhabdus singularis TaxID=2518993 RepID=A0ABT3TGL5_9GAMM|nr:ATP-NAD kinase family protein [Candidatus Litorirhabdus singularis]MCX2981458.1 ATP-NAD kinase [Candidatus Litorirhabdus singularis]